MSKITNTVKDNLQLPLDTIEVIAGTEKFLFRRVGLTESQVVYECPSRGETVIPTELRPRLEFTIKRANAKRNDPVAFATAKHRLIRHIKFPMYRSYSTPSGATGQVLVHADDKREWSFPANGTTFSTSDAIQMYKVAENFDAKQDAQYQTASEYMYLPDFVK
jgi:hypothetical protein